MPGPCSGKKLISSLVTDLYSKEKRLGSSLLNIICYLRLTKAVSKYEGPKKIPGAPFSVSFSQLPAVKKDTENGAPGYFFGPSYFVTALIK